MYLSYVAITVFTENTIEFGILIYIGNHVK